MMTVNEVSKLTGVSIRALQYYDKIGLLHPAEYTEAGYRLYDDTALERLQQILLFRELEFSLKEIQSILQRGVMLIFSDFGKCKDGDPALPEAQALVKRLQAYISENYYQCTPEILQTLGAMYGAGGEFTENIDKAGGEGTAKFVERAISIYCK